MRPLREVQLAALLVSPRPRGSASAFNCTHFLHFLHLGNETGYMLRTHTTYTRAYVYLIGVYVC